MKIVNKEEETSSSAQLFKVAVVQASPVVFDREKTLEKVHVLSGEAAHKGATLALFPEAFVSAYPRGLDFGAVIGSRSEEGREDFRRYWESSVDVPGPAVDALSRTARSHNIYLIVAPSTVPYCSSRPTVSTWASIARSCQPLPSGWCGVLAMARRCRCSPRHWEGSAQ